MAFAIPMGTMDYADKSSTAAPQQQQQQQQQQQSQNNKLRLLKDNSGRLTVEYDILVKSIIIGDSSVGKSCLLHRFSENDYNEHYISTVGVDYKTLTFQRPADNKVIKLNVWDTAGQDRFKTITRTFYRGIHGVMLCFALDDLESFYHISDWVKEATQFGSEDLPFVLIGNKCDIPSQLREVPTEMGQQLAQKLNCPYIETSAKSGSNVAEAFGLLVEACVARKMQQNNNNSHDAMRNAHKRIQLGEGNNNNNNRNNNTGGKTTCAC